ncbi:FtsW/RodA/SpoVE family cell cycle protein [Marinilactibacillus kalidii]|uniref:FtsW/RodA/SpoVE family cell cycle protein n=1 Tax=Marinilactibacillus kalidii TaxID=2820274 RepID=UPI001ABDE196|nr:FtsW/RodA/SpoVE family cell cycle protein [Marinilactibacillus kalidii]
MKNNDSRRIDYGIVLMIMLLALFSVTTIYSTTVLMQGDSLKHTVMQVLWYILGVITVVIIMQFDSEKMWRMTTYLYIIGLVVLLLTVLFYDRHLHLLTGGKRWVRLGPLGTMQPSEFVKIPYILMLSKVVTLHNSRTLLKSVQTDAVLLVKLLFFSLIPITLVFMQNDLGTALVYIAIAIGITLLSGITWKILVPIFLLLSIFGGTLIVLVTYNRDLLMRLGFQGYQFARIDTWLNPHEGSTDATFQVLQAFKAIGSGGVFGKGLGVSDVYVPVRESDMIFSTIGENFGFIGSSILIFIYFMLIYYMVRIIYDTKNEFYAYIATGVIMMIVFHVLENIGMNTGLLPMTGIPLPFISQGGSALIGNMMGIGVMMSMRFHHKSYMFSGDDKSFHADS